MTQVLTAKEVTAAYGELVLVEAPAIDLFASLGWSTANLYTETFGSEGTEGRLSESEVILVRRLRMALERLNPGLPADAYTQAIDELTRDRSKQLPATANREFYRLLRDRVKVQISDDEGNPSKQGHHRRPDRPDRAPADRDWLRPGQAAGVLRRRDPGRDCRRRLSPRSAQS